MVKSVSMGACVQEEGWGKQRLSEDRGCLLVVPEQGGEGLRLDPNPKDCPGLFSSLGLHFPARAIFEKLIFNDTSKP